MTETTTAAPISGDALRGHLELIILVSVNRQAQHGYALAASMRSRSNGAFSIQEGSLYPALHRMRKAGLIRGSWQEGGEIGPRRLVYSITETGREALRKQQADWNRLMAAVDAVIEN